jgi:hypothetical protein
MSETIKEFYDRFVRDFSTFDGELIASRYMHPYSAMSPDGDIWQCNSQSELVEYFQSLLDRHLSNGVVKGKYEDLETIPIGKKCHMASVTWTMTNADDQVVSHWRESYNLLETDDGLKIFTSIDHA